MKKKSKIQQEQCMSNENHEIKQEHLPSVRVKLDFGISAMAKLSIIEDFFVWVEKSERDIDLFTTFVEYKKYLMDLERRCKDE